ncbi:uncharacterized protein [Coffea arabica]|uniref:Retrotransposon Copia-like N-terminal domain-containing protein n=1 Tax=Coffea arabica TaxID=13443 RepID=A0A6P6XJ43_COFAR
MSNNLSLRTILTDCKLNDTNFLDWHRNVLIVLTHEKIEYVLDGPMPQEPEPTAPAAVRNAYKKHKDDNREASCIMVASMTPQLQQQHMNMGAYDIVQHLRELFEQQSRTVRYDTSKELFRCKMAEGAPVAPHFVMNYQMNNLQHTLPQLLNVLKTAEKEIKKGKGSTGVLVVTSSKKRKRQE